MRARCTGVGTVEVGHCLSGGRCAAKRKWEARRVRKKAMGGVALWEGGITKLLERRVTTCALGAWIDKKKFGQREEAHRNHLDRGFVYGSAFGRCRTATNGINGGTKRV